MDWTAEAAIDLFEEYGRYTINVWIVRVSFEYLSGFILSSMFVPCK